MSNASQEKTAGIARVREGMVSSVSGEKTIRVDLANRVKHPLYGKYISKRTRLLVHDEENAAKVGDTVEIVPCRRRSKNKAWRLVRVVRHAALEA
jgi:small subunit ribosomal protein S17